MRILTARLNDFRNIRQAELQVSDRLNALIGPNGQGKTNLLEALYTLGALRPLRSVPRSNLIRTGAERARVRAQVRDERTGLTHELDLELTRNGRTLQKDGKPTDASSFIGVLTAVAFTPDDLEITKGGPDIRRRFLDRAVLNTRPGYLQVALRYTRALRSRNRVLSDGGSDDVLDAFDETVAIAGAQVAVARASYAAAFSERVRSAFDGIAQPAPELTIRYRSSLGDGLDLASADATAEAFGAQLAARRGRDRARGSTSVGPHLDNLELRLDGHPARVRASQGQHRALVLAIKLAEITHLAEEIGQPPVLLLDDISSELDAERSRQLFDALSRLDAQVLLTTTDAAHVPDDVMRRLAPAHVFDVASGVITRRPDATPAG